MDYLKCKRQGACISCPQRSVAGEAEQSIACRDEEQPADGTKGHSGSIHTRTNVMETADVWMRLSIATTLWIGAVHLAWGGAYAASQDIRVVFRYDDPSAKSDMDVEQRVIDAFRRRGMTCTFGVVPYVCAGSNYDVAPQRYLPLPKEKADMLAAAARQGVVEIAQHGYSHQNNGRTTGDYSEFARLDFDDQMQRIDQGKRLLESELAIEVDIFVPPWNTYDANTCLALNQLEFSCLSADARGPADLTTSLRFVPRTCGLLHVRDAIRMARKHGDAAPLIVVLFHGYDFHETGSSRSLLTYEQFEKTLNWLMAQGDVRVCSMREIHDADAARYLNFQGLQRVQQWLPQSWRVFPESWVYPSREASLFARSRCIRRVWMLYGCVVLAAGVLGGGASTLVRAKLPAVAWWVLFISCSLLLAGASLWAFRDGRLGSTGLIVVAAFLGWCFGNLLAGYLNRRRWRTSLG